MVCVYLSDMELGQLLQASGFGLLEAMSAIEVRDQPRGGTVARVILAFFSYHVRLNVRSSSSLLVATRLRLCCVSCAYDRSWTLRWTVA
jgi:hypothetical protein